MRVIIVGAGRSGTNWAMEIVRCSGKYEFTEAVQDNGFFDYEILPKNYGTKVPTEHRDFNLRNLKRVMRRHKKMRVIFTVRHPFDLALSKIYRGQPAELGGDLPGRSPDASLGGALYAVEFMYLIYKHMRLRWDNRILTVRLEDLILDPGKPIGEICRFLELEEQPKMHEAYKLIRNQHKHKRYHYKVQKNQVGLHQRWQSIYGGFFKKRENEVAMIFRELDYVVKGLGYE